MKPTASSPAPARAGGRRSRALLIACLLPLATGCGKELDAADNGANAADCAMLMGGWVHRDTQLFTYFMPNANWQAVESTNSLKVSGPVGEAAVIFSYFYSYTAPTSVEALEQVVWQYDIKGVNVLARTNITQSSIGATRTTEFTGTWIETGHAVNGILIVYVNAAYGQAVDQVYLVMANTDQWRAMAPSLACLRDNMRYKGYSPNAPE